MFYGDYMRKYRYVVLYSFDIYDIVINDYGDMILIDLETKDYQINYTNHENGKYEELEICVREACASERDDERIKDYLHNVSSILQYGIVLAEEVSE